MTKITIEVDGSQVAANQIPASPTEEVATGVTPPSGTNNAGGAPSVDTSHIGPIAHMSSTGSTETEQAFNPDGAISAGPAPATLMGGVE